MTGERRHPQRAPAPQGTVYRRHIRQLGVDFSLRTLDVSRDLEIFQITAPLSIRWSRTVPKGARVTTVTVSKDAAGRYLDRVAQFWDMKGSRDVHARYLAEQAADPHVHMMLGCVGEPRVDHVRHIAMMHSLGAYTVKEFDFPHKRAALVVVDRETFFDEFGP